MRSVRRITTVAGLRLRESARGPLVVFLLLFLTSAVAITILVPGEPGPDRQRAVDRLVLGAALFVSVFAAASLAAASGPADRAAGRDAVLDATAIRPVESVLGTWLGHGLAIAILLAAFWPGAIAAIGLFSGGDRDRGETRTAIFPTRLVTADGETARGPILLARPGDFATYVMSPLPSRTSGTGFTVRLPVFATEMSIDFPESFPVLVRVGNRAPRKVTVVRGDPLRFRIHNPPSGGNASPEVRIERVGPVYALQLLPDGLVAEGEYQPFTLNVGKSLLAWFGGLLVLAAAATALAVFVQSPVAVAGTLLLALVAHSLGLISEAAGYMGEGSPGRLVLTGVVSIWPDLAAADLTDPVVSRWDIGGELLRDRIPPTLMGSGFFLGFAWLLTVVRRRR